MPKPDEKIRSGDRFMPCVLGRLTDQNPQTATEHFSRGISIKQLKRDILWNIEMILNSRSHPGRAELNNDGMICDSVLGMGLPDFCGISHSPEQLEKLRKEILHQLRCFEPRINADSLTVTLIQEKQGVSGNSVLEMEILGQIEVAPLREELVFQSRLDLESGTTSVKLLEER